MSPFKVIFILIKLSIEHFVFYLLNQASFAAFKYD